MAKAKRSAKRASKRTSKKTAKRRRTEKDPYANRAQGFRLVAALAKAHLADAQRAKRAKKGAAKKSAKRGAKKGAAKKGSFRRITMDKASSYDKLLWALMGIPEGRKAMKKLGLNVQTF